MRRAKKVKQGTAALKKGMPRFFRALFYSKEISGVTSNRARAFLNGRLSRFFAMIARSVSNTSTRLFGFFALTFGLASLLVHLGKYYLEFIPAISFTDIIIGSVFVLCAVPLLLHDKPINIALQEVRVIDYILFEFFAMNRATKSEKVRTLHPFFGILIGIALTVCGTFFPLLYVALGVVFALFFAVSMVSPEFPIVFSLLCLPYLGFIPHSDNMLILLSLLAFVSFFRKVLIGKRVYSLEVHDAILLLFVGVMAIGAVLDSSRETTVNTWLYASVMLSYIPLSNMIVNRRLAICFSNAAIVAMVPVGIWAISEYVMNHFSGAHAPSRASLSSPPMLAAFLCVAAIISIFFVSERGGAAHKTFYGILSCIYVVALVTTECVPIVLCAVLLIPAYFIVRSLSLPRELLIIPALLPAAVFFLPDTLLRSVSSAFYAMPDLVGIKANIIESIKVFLDNFLFGIGADSFAGASYVEGNLFTGIGVRYGVIAVAIVLFFAFARLRQHTVYSIYRTASNVSGFITVGTLSAFTLITLGNFYDLFADAGVLYLFFASVGIYAGAFRVSKREHDDRLGYYGDQRSIDSSAVDVIIRH